MIEPQISVIVPVYNAERYLRKCLDSLIGQSYSNIEIICVNDGSTDGSLAIMKQYAARDSRIKIVNQANGGLSAARNSGIQISQAPYLMFCDSDDWFEPEMCGEMLQALLDNNVDVVACQARVVYEQGKRPDAREIEYYRLKYRGVQRLTRQTMLNTDIGVWNKIFKRSILNDFDIWFPVGLYYEDAYFCNAYMAATKTIYYLDKPLYNYLRRPSSMMSETYAMTNRAADHLTIILKFHDFLNQNGLFEVNSEFFWTRFIEYYLLSMRLSPKTLHEQLQHQAQEFYVEHTADWQNIDKKLQSELRKALYNKRRIWPAIKESLYSIYLRLIVATRKRR